MGSESRREDPKQLKQAPPFPKQKQAPTGREHKMDPKPDFGADSYVTGEVLGVTGGKPIP